MWKSFLMHQTLLVSATIWEISFGVIVLSSTGKSMTTKRVFVIQKLNFMCLYNKLCIIISLQWWIRNLGFSKSLFQNRFSHLRTAAFLKQSRPKPFYSCPQHCSKYTPGPLSHSSNHNLAINIMGLWDYCKSSCFEYLFLFFDKHCLYTADKQKMEGGNREHRFSSKGVACWYHIF